MIANLDETQRAAEQVSIVESRDADETLMEADVDKLTAEKETEQPSEQQENQAPPPTPPGPKKQAQGSPLTAKALKQEHLHRTPEELQQMLKELAAQEKAAQESGADES